MSYTKVKNVCKCGCGQSFMGHPNKKFLNSHHKDRYWNKENPRGIGLSRKIQEHIHFSEDTDYDLF